MPAGLESPAEDNDAHSSPLLALLLAATLGLGAAACGSDDDDDISGPTSCTLGPYTFEVLSGRIGGSLFRAEGSSEPGSIADTGVTHFQPVAHLHNPRKAVISSPQPRAAVHDVVD